MIIALCPFPYLERLVNHIPPHPSAALVLMPYFFLNFSTRPAESTNFCLPVKKGWQLEQISTWIFSTVERVSTTWPQAQVIVAVLYSGWIPAFINSSPGIVFYNIRISSLQTPDGQAVWLGSERLSHLKEVRPILVVTSAEKILRRTDLSVFAQVLLLYHRNPWL